MGYPFVISSKECTVRQRSRETGLGSCFRRNDKVEGGCKGERVSPKDSNGDSVYILFLTPLSPLYEVVDPFVKGGIESHFV